MSRAGQKLITALAAIGSWWFSLSLSVLWRWLVLPQQIENWSLTSLRQRLRKTDERLTKRTPYYWLVLVGRHLSQWRSGVVLGAVGFGQAQVLGTGEGRWQHLRKSS